MKLEKSEVIELNRSILVMEKVINKLEEDKEEISSVIQEDITLLSNLYYESEFNLQNVVDPLDKALVYYIVSMSRLEELNYIIDEIEYKKRLTIEYLKMSPQIMEV